jgi:hypothetical protein
MACTSIITSLAAQCSNQPGGINKFYLTNYDNIVEWVDAGALDPFDFDSVDFGQVALTAVTLANPAVATTATPHGLNSGNVLIAGTSPMDGLVGNHAITVLSSTTFSIDGYDTSTGIAAFGASAVSVYEEGGAFMEVKMKKNVPGANSPFSINDGANYFSPAVTGTYQGSTKVARDFFTRLSASLVVCVEVGANGLVQVYGNENGLEVSELVYNNGPGPGDVTGFTFTLTGAESKPYYLLDPAYALPVFEA